MGRASARSALVRDQKTTARLTGVLYLLLAVCGAVGFLALRSQLYAPADAAQTARNLVEHALSARLLLVFELAVVITQALAALWFFKLLRPVNDFAAASVAAFGLINAMLVLGSAACMTVGVEHAHDADPATTQLLFALSSAAWRVGSVFFGLWLIPMGFAARASNGAMPRALGWTLMLGGVGYVLSALISVGIEGVPQSLVDGLTIPASIGEFWMIGFLLIIGWRETPLSAS